VTINLDTGWRIGEETFAFIVSRLRQTKAVSLLEFGSGASTVRFAMGLPEMRIVSVEHDEAFLRDTATMLGGLPGASTRVTLVHAPLRPRRFGVRMFFTYGYSPVDPFDAIVIDGPPGFTRRGREACLYLAYEKLRVGGTVFLDDADRDDERRIVANWSERLRGSASFATHAVGHGLAEVTKNDALPMRLGGAGVLDNWRIAARTRFITCMRRSSVTNRYPADESL
jgi:predicted O-methyltransferase YrrM